nr:GPP34 family phosphoprotein [Gilvimarinus sp. DA14]
MILLALRDEKGTIATGFGFIEQVIAGAVLAELLLANKISVENSKKQLVDIESSAPIGDPVVDECLAKMTKAKRRSSLKNWISRLAGVKELKHKAAQQLCERDILRADEQTILFLFKRRVYPEIDPAPEREIIARLKTAIFTETEVLDPRTVVLVSLANGSGILQETFARKELKPYQQRVEKIQQGELTGKATQQVIAACQSAVIVAAVVPAIAASTISS